MQKLVPFLLFIAFWSCQTPASQEEEVEVEVEQQVDATATESVQSVLQSPNTPDGQILEQTPPLSVHAQQFFSNQLWHFDAAVVIRNPEKAKVFSGKWIDFHSNNTFEFGFYDQSPVSGYWVFDEEKEVLTLMEDGERPSFSEYKIRRSSSSDDIMIWVGTKRFGNNSEQIKLLRRNGTPQKKAGN